MLNKLTPKQEAFALKYMETGNASEAYRQSYDSENMKSVTINRTAKELLDNPKIAARVGELQANAQRRHEVTVDSLTEEYDEAKLKAYELEQISAGISAINGKAKIHGFDKVVHDGEIRTVVKIVDLTGKRDE